MRDVTSIDDELSLVAEVRSALLADGCDPGAWQLDPLLDERLTISSRRACTGAGRRHFTISFR